MSSTDWLNNPYLAPGVIVVVVLAVIGWIRSYLSGKKSNIKEAQDLVDKVEDRAKAKTVQERILAKDVENENKERAINVRTSVEHYVDEKDTSNKKDNELQRVRIYNKIDSIQVQIQRIRKDLDELFESKK